MRLIDKTKEIWNKGKGDFKRNLLKIVLGVPFWLIIASLGLIGFGVGRAIYLTESRPDQYMAELWQNGGDTAFRHMTVYAGGIRSEGDKSPMTYVEGGKSIKLADISLIRQSLQTAASTGTEAGNKSVTFREDKLKGWEDCYSSTVLADIDCLDVVDGLEVTTSTAETQLIAVGGNYKAFHPFRFLSGGFLPEVPVDTYQIVINDVLAWKFFRSYDVVGNRVDINGQMFTIIGVVEEKNTKVAELAGEQANRAFIYFAALDKLYKSSTVTDETGADYNPYQYADFAIQCYEAMLPELVRGVAVSDFKNAMPNYSLTNPQLLVVNNTGRFGVFRVFDTIFPLGESAKERLGYEFPYWETAAQMTEERLFYDYVIVIFGIILMLIGVAMIALKFRAKKTIIPAELEVVDSEELLESGEKQLMLKA